MDGVMTDYEQFLSTKRLNVSPCGIDMSADDLPHALFDWQREITAWALRRGRAALFEDCGMGKTAQQLVWAQVICDHTKRDVLILTPLAVSRQTAREAVKFDLSVTVCRSQADVRPGINVTNYERLHLFDVAHFVGIVLDESSILKAYDSKTRTQIIEAFSQTPYRLACTATPAPNDHMELGNHAEFLGIMSRAEMLAMFFTHDGGQTSKWRIKGHGEDEFWRWVCEWAVMLRRPSDLGYNDDGFILPQLSEHVTMLEAQAAPGMLFAVEALTLTERRNARKASLSDRVQSCADLVKSDKNPWIVWCDLNAEADALERAIPGAIQIAGSDKPEAKEQRMIDFASGKIRVLVTKPSIAGFGMNWQHCANIAFVGLSDSYESRYQAIRRCWRYGQVRPVGVHNFLSIAEGAVLKNLQRKEQEAERMAEGMVRHMEGTMRQNLGQTERQEVVYVRKSRSGDGWTAHLADCVDVLKEIADDSIDYSIFSPPFASLYTYSNSERDMGNVLDYTEFAKHFAFAIHELYRVLRPGRLLSFHCMNLQTLKSRDGYIGIRDFRGDLIRMFEAVDFIYHSEVCIWKDPVTAMHRTNALGLLYKQLKKDSAMSRQGIADYLVTMRKPGENAVPVTKNPDDFSVELWQRYASPVWMDIDPFRTLQHELAREEKDERHICPLQLEVIERAIDLWTNPGDLVLSPFMGIGSEGHVALKKHRQFVGIELKQSYYELAVRNLAIAEIEARTPDLFTMSGITVGG